MPSSIPRGDFTSKLLTALLASATALALSTSVWAAGQTDPQSRDNQTQAQPNATKGKPDQNDANAVDEQTQNKRHARSKRHHDSQASDTSQSSQANSSDTPTSAAGSPGQHDAQAAANDDRMKGTSPDDGRAATGANDPGSNQSSDQANRSGAQPNTPGSSSDEAYSAELKKCDSMQGDRKQKCITSAKKKAGQM